MRVVTNYQYLTNGILRAVKDCTSVPSRVLVDQVALDLGYKNKIRIRTMINTLVCSGRLGGHTNRNGVAQNVRHKELHEPDDNLVSRDQLQSVVDELESLEAKLRQTEKELDEERNKEAPSTVLEVRVTQNGKTRVVKDLFHEKFARILKLAQARKNIFIYGPTGCGKSYVAAQVAKTLKLPFYFVSCTAGMSEGVLAGRLLPVGKQGTFEYVISEFIKAYETGGVFLLDEVDAADPNVMLIINSALANGKMAVSNRPAKPYAVKHKNFICIASANTVGTGSDRMYSGRNKLDAATLDRFGIGKLHMDYDARVEAQLCPNDDLRNRLLRYRDAIQQHGLERALSTRFMYDAWDMTENHGWNMHEVEEALFEGWREDEVNKVRSYVQAA